MCVIAGTYNPRTGLSHYHECLGCPSGRFCNESGLDAPSGDCLAGFLCVENATHPAPSDGINMPCPVGHYCLAGKIIIIILITVENLNRCIMIIIIMIMIVIK